EQRHVLGATPAAGLVDVPCHLHHDDVAELAGLDVLGGLDVRRRRPALRAHGDHLLRAFDGLEEGAGIVHAVRGRLFHVGVAAGLHRFNAVPRVLEVGSGNEDGVNVLARVERIVVDHGIDLVAGELGEVFGALLALQLPDVGDGDQLEVQVLGVGHEGGDVAAAHAVSEADDARAHTVVRAGDFRVARRRGGDRVAGGGGDGGCGS